MLKSLNEFRNQFLIRTNTGEPKRMTTLAQSIPLAPIFHFSPPNPGAGQLGPEPTDLIVNAINTGSKDMNISVFHVTEVSKGIDLGNHFNKKLANEDKLIRTYFTKYRQFSRVFDINTTLKKKQPLLINYQILPELYPLRLKTLDTYRMVQEIWWKEVWSNVGEIVTDRLQFVSIFTPRMLKPAEYYLKLLKNQTVTELRKIHNRDDLILLDLFGFYTGLKEDTVIGQAVVKLYPSLFTEDKQKGDKLVDEPQVILALRDGVNVIYVDLRKLTEWAISEQQNPNTKFDWIYGLFAAQVDTRVVAEAVVEETYHDEVARVKEEAKKEIPHSERTSVDLTNAVLDEADTLLASGAISEGEYKGNLKLAGRYKSLTDPLSGEPLQTIIDAAEAPMTETPESTVPDIGIIDDKSYLSNTVREMDKAYIEKRLDKDIINAICQLPKEGVVITNIKKTEHKDAANDRVTIAFQTKPVKGDISTTSITYPRVRPDGTMLSGGVTYRMNKQNNEVPIVKIEPNNVALTSYAMGKMFVKRGFLETDNEMTWLMKNLNLACEQGKITGDRRGNTKPVIDMDLDIPITYSQLSYRFREFSAASTHFMWCYNERAEFFKVDPKDLKAIEKHGVLCGMRGKDPVVMDMNNILYQIRDGKPNPLGTIEDLLEIDTTKKPIEWAGVKIKGKVIPVGVLLAYWKGLDAFFKYIDVKVTEYEPNVRIPNADAGLVIKFKDVKILVEYDTPMQELLLAGFKYMKVGFREASYDSLSKPNGWPPVLGCRGLGNSQIKELTRIRRNWIDPNTKKQLDHMGEPNKIIPLMIRSVELLTTRQHYDESDGSIKVYKGYDRIPDIIQRELIKGHRDMNAARVTAKTTFQINPNAVMMAIITDDGVSPTESTNPFQVSGEQDRITYSGANGRSNRTLVARHRKFDKKSRGIISEGFTDNGKAGTILYYTNNPNVTTLYGNINSDGEKDLGNLVSAAALVSPFSMKDDPKRTNFARIQLDAWMNALGHQGLPVRTGYELVEAHRCGEGFSFVSEDAGKVTALDERSITVEYKNGKTRSYLLGREFGSAAGKVFPREKITDRKVGYKFEKGEVLAWDKFFFYRDWIETTQVAIYTGVPAIVAMCETPDTYEDGCAISSKYAKRIGSAITHTRELLVDFDQYCELLVKIGDHVESEDPIARILPAGVTVDPDDVLSIDYLSTTSPRARHPGVIERIEVTYCGDIADSGESVRKIINMGNKQRAIESKITGGVSTGEIAEPTYISQNYVGRNTCLIRIYITHEDVLDPGDKIAFCNALKSVPGLVYSTIYRTLSGLELDAKFSYKGIMARIVKSPEFMGVINMIMRQIGLNAAKLYHGEKL